MTNPEPFFDPGAEPVSSDLPSEHTDAAAGNLPGERLQEGLLPPAIRSGRVGKDIRRLVSLFPFGTP
ncbi:MAG TPA: hypothetical protein VH593_18535 [Ktedonobacteraceae bacterium]